MLISLCVFLRLGTSPLTVVPTTGQGKELEEPCGKKGEQDAQLELIFHVNVIETWFFLLLSFSLCYLEKSLF